MQPPKQPPTTLVPGVDYYMEAGKFVFTAAYHLRRGYCCNSGCRHCPYREAETIAVPAIPPIKLPGKP